MKLLGLDLNNLLSDKQSLDIWRATLPFLSMVAAGLLLIALYSLQFVIRDPATSLSVFGVATTVAGASLLVGGLLGFLFGIPRIVEVNQPGTITSNETTNGSGPSSLDPAPVGVVYPNADFDIRANTNLEQISDWLTKILVGVGLTQITGILSAIDRLTNKLAPGIGGADAYSVASSSSFTLAVLVYFLISGFFLGFLWARLYLPRRFRDAEIQQLGQEFKKVGNQLEDVQQLGQEIKNTTQQLNNDANAQVLVNRQLNLRFPEVQPEVLTQAFKAASPPVRLSIFIEAQRIRSETWDDRSTLPKMERTIAIFQALINSDPQNPYHRYYGELGFTLKDKQEPEWERAESALSRAIELRGDWHTHGAWTTYYEFNRALCRINLDQKFQNNQVSDQPTREAIFQDLLTAGEGGTLTKGKKIEGTKIRPWLTLNGIGDDQVLSSQALAATQS